MREDSPAGSNGRSLNLEDIAAQAGVSRSTVSRVINNEPYVSQKTRDKVMAIIEREGFIPNPAARMLVTQRTRTIGVVIPQTLSAIFEDSFYFPTLLQGISDVTHARDYALLLWLEESSTDGERFYKRILRNRLMDGLVIASSTTASPGISELIEMEIPLVMVERPAIFPERISYVSVDNVHAARLAIQHLIGLGYQRIATVTGALNNVDGQDRLAGYKSALESAQIPIRNELIAEGQFSRASGYTGTKQLLRHKPEAIFAASDQTALGVLEALSESGLRVPQDVAVVGFDDMPSALRTKPPLTTIRHPIREKGARATSLLLDEIEGISSGTRQVLLPTQLVIRESCGAIIAS